VADNNRAGSEAKLVKADSNFSHFSGSRGAVISNANGGGADSSRNPEPACGPQQTIGSEMQPRSIFSPHQTAMAANQLFGQGLQSAFSQMAQGPGLPGFASYSPGLMSRGAMNAGNALLGGMRGAEGLRLSDRAANMSNLLQGQIGRAADFLGKAYPQFGFDAANRQYSNQAAGGMLSGILARLGGLGGMQQRGIADRGFWANLGLGQQQLGVQNMLNAAGLINNFQNIANMYQQQRPNFMTDLMWA
jgi:hypothetical protein